MDDIRTLFEQTRTFAGLTGSTLDLLVACARHRGLREGDTLFRQEAPREAFYLIVSGQLEILRETAGRVERLIVLGPGQAVGEGAFLHASQHSATARALTEVALVELPREEVHARLATDGAAAIEVLSRVALAMNRRLQYAAASEVGLEKAYASGRHPPRARPARRAGRARRRAVRHADAARGRELPHHRHQAVALPHAHPVTRHGQAGVRAGEPQARPARSRRWPGPSTGPARRSSTATGTAISSSTWCRAVQARRPT